MTEAELQQNAIAGSLTPFTVAKVVEFGPLLHLP